MRTNVGDDEEPFQHDSADLIDWSAAQSVVLPKLRPTLKSISLRLPEPMLNRLCVMANERDIPYQSLIKMILAEHLEKSGGRLVG